jgi:hypothetical protein
MTGLPTAFFSPLTETFGEWLNALKSSRPYLKTLALYQAFTGLHSIQATMPAKPKTKQSTARTARPPYSSLAYELECTNVSHLGHAAALANSM